MQFCPKTSSRNMKKILLLVIFSTSLGYGQLIKKSSGKGPTEDIIFALRRDADAAVVVNVQSIVPDTCGAFSSDETFVISGKIVKKYFDRTGKFKEQKITFLSTDTSAYTAAPHYIVFVNKAKPELTQSCKDIYWTSKPGASFVFTPKTETLVGKKREQ